MKTILSKTVALWPLMAILLSPFATNGATTAWIQRYNGAGNGDDSAQAVAVDAGGNVCVTGYSLGTGTSLDYVTIKYSSAGIPLWTNRYNGLGNGDDYANAVVVDGAGDVYVAGYSKGLGNTLDFDYVTIKYSSAGVGLWTNRFDGPANGLDRAYDLALDGITNVCVTGQSATSGSGSDYVTIMYSSAGIPLWTNRYNGTGNGDDIANALAVDHSNNVCVTGYSLDSGIDYDYATIKYSATGVPLWTNRYSGPGSSADVANAVAVDGSNNVCVTGSSPGSGSSDDYATVKYSSAGVPLWTNRYNGPGNGADLANAVAVDAGDNVYVTGYSRGSDTRLDYATIKYSSAGMPLWTNRFDGPATANDSGVALAVDNPGNVFVTGYSDGTGSASDYATMAYATTGGPLWTNRYNGPASGSDQPLTRRSLALAGHGSVIVVGRSQGINTGSTNNDWAVVKYANLLSVIGMTNLGPAAWLLVCKAAPGSPAITQFATNLTASPWFYLSTNTADSNGLWTVLDTSATNRHRFYRLLSQ